jgi:holo-[acyl-carrier protein] synthase
MGQRIGVDLVPLDRVRQLLSQPGTPVLRRMLSAEELSLSVTAAGPDQAGLAGRLAAKEAVFKLFHAAGQTLPWLATEILKDPGGWPLVRLSGKAAALAAAAGIGHIEVSISHDENYAVAVAVATRDT